MHTAAEQALGKVGGAEHDEFPQQNYGDGIEKSCEKDECNCQ